MSAQICPSILATDVEEYLEQLERVEDFAKRIQIDLSDGQFTDMPTVGIADIFWPKSLKVDIHLMYKDPTKVVDDLLDLKPHLVIVHAESKDDHIEIARKLRNKKIKAGLAVLPHTRVADIINLLKEFDHLMIFGGHLGHFGGEADLTQSFKIAEALNVNPKLEIGWDGGVNKDNVQDLVAAGVDVLNVGGYIQNAAEPAEVFNVLSGLV